MSENHRKLPGPHLHPIYRHEQADEQGTGYLKPERDLVETEQCPKLYEADQHQISKVTTLLTCTEILLFGPARTLLFTVLLLLPEVIG